MQVSNQHAYARVGPCSLHLRSCVNDFKCLGSMQLWRQSMFAPSLHILQHSIQDAHLLQALMREQMRNQDRTMANIESHPEGFNALRRMYENFQEPLMNAATGQGNNQQDPLAALLSGATAGNNASSGKLLLLSTVCTCCRHCQMLPDCASSRHIPFHVTSLSSCTLWLDSALHHASIQHSFLSAAAAGHNHQANLNPCQLYAS